ncbi:MAG: GH32 C-terminal domain-containing protein [Pirellulaceae bacterium]
MPRELSLPDDGVLRIKPLRELESLRYDQRVETQIDVKSDAPYRLKQIEGDALELNVALKPGTAAQFGVEVHCDEQGTNGFQIAVEPASKSLRLGDTVAPFELQAGEDLELRVFIDKNVIEVFANERQAVVASHPYDPQKCCCQPVQQRWRRARHQCSRLEDEFDLYEMIVVVPVKYQVRFRLLERVVGAELLPTAERRATLKQATRRDCVWHAVSTRNC